MLFRNVPESDPEDLLTGCIRFDPSKAETMQLSLQEPDLDALARKVAGLVIDRLGELRSELPEHQVDELLDESGAAEVLGLRPSTLTKWRQLQKGPPYHALTNGADGRAAIRYARRDLLAWAAERRVDPTREEVAE